MRSGLASVDRQIVQAKADVVWKDNFNSYDGSVLFPSWLLRVAGNHCIDALRRWRGASRRWRQLRERRVGRTSVRGTEVTSGNHQSGI